MLLDAGHVWPLQVPSLSKEEPLVICGTPGPRRTSQDLAGLHRGVFVTELGYGRDIQAKCGFPGELKKLIGTFPFTTAPALEALCNASEISSAGRAHAGGAAGGAGVCKNLGSCGGP